MLSTASITRGSEQARTVVVGRASPPPAAAPATLHVDEGEGAHSPLGPSSSERWLRCPGSVRATRGLPDRPSSYSLEGTAAHYVSHLCRELGVSAETFLGAAVVIKHPSGSFGVTVDQAMADGVDEFIEYVSDFPGEALYETRVSYDAWVDEGFGTLDDARMSDRRCVITDFKYGQGVQVYAKNNTQLMLYALGIFQDFGALYEIDEFQLNIFQPRLHHVDSWTISTADLLRWAESVAKPGALRTKDPEALFDAGPWCQFCRLKESCKVRAEWVMRQVTQDFVDLDAGLQQTAAIVKDSEARERAISEMTGTDLALVLSVLDGIRSWCKDVELHAMRRVQKGEDLGGFKLVEGRSNRVWSEPADAVAKVLFTAGVPEDVIWKKKLVSPSKAEKSIGKKRAAVVLSGLVEKPRGKPKLAPPEDPRPALVVDPNEEFDVLETTDDE